MESFEYNEKNIIRYYRWTSMIADCINNVGKANNGKKGSEIGLQGFVFLDLLQRVASNLHGMNSLFNDFIRFPEMRFPLNLIFRGVLSDILNGLYLAHFSREPVSFENEIKMLDRDFAQFAKFIIENEALLTMQISNEESEKFISEYKEEYIKENSDLFQDVENWKLKTPVTIRATSNTSLFFGEDHFNRPLTDAIKSRVLENTEALQHLQLTYLLYRYFSQYQHYSYKGRTTLSMPVEYDMQKYYVSFMMINESVHIFCKLIGAEDMYLELLRAVGDEYIIKK